MQSSSSRGVAAVAGQEFASHLAGGYDVDWRLLAAKLPTGKDKESRAARERLWRKADANGNGFLSLAEIDKALHDEQGFEQLFGAKPVLMRAFQSARQAVKSRDSRGDDYVEKAEFRQLLVALRQVFEVYLIFNRIDTSDDRRISLDEFKEKLPELERWGAPIEDAEAEFARIAGGAEGGAEGGGQLLFTDFCAWALERSLDLEDDDDWEPDGGGAAAPTGADALEPPKPGPALAAVLAAEGKPPTAVAVGAAAGATKRAKAAARPAPAEKPTPSRAGREQKSRGVAAVAGQEFASHLAGGYNVDWRLLAAKLPTGKDKESRAARERLWRKADANGNGFLSLAEIDKALHDEQGFEQLFGAKPVLMRAFQSARQAVKSRDSRGDDYVEKAEFRQLLVALRQVFEVYLIFNRIDTSDDRRISLDEFKEKLPELERWGAPIEDAEAEFARIAGGAEGGAEGGGQLLFTDFCAWALERSLDLEDDDDWEPDGGGAAAPTGAAGSVPVAAPCDRGAAAPEAGAPTLVQEAVEEAVEEEEEVEAPEEALVSAEPTLTVSEAVKRHAVGPAAGTAGAGEPAACRFSASEVRRRRLRNAAPPSPPPSCAAGGGTCTGAGGGEGSGARSGEGRAAKPAAAADGAAASVPTASGVTSRTAGVEGGAVLKAAVSEAVHLRVAAPLEFIAHALLRPEELPELSTAEYTARVQLQQHLEHAVSRAWAESGTEADAQLGLPPLPFIAHALLTRAGQGQQAELAALRSEHERLRQLCASRNPELLSEFERRGRP